MNHIDSTRPSPLSMNELTTEFLNDLEFLYILEFGYKYYVIQNIEILGIKPRR